MEALFWAVFTILVWLAISVVFPKFTTTTRKLPPGPKPWPIIGNLYLIGPSPHASFDKLAKTYGDLMMLRFGNRPVVVASSPAIAKEFLKTHDHNFCSRPVTAAGKYTTYNYSDMLWAPYGPHWRQARRIYLNELFSPRQLDTYEYIRVEEMRAFISRIFSTSGKEIVLRDHLMRFTLANISRMALGDKYFNESGTGSEKSNLEEKVKDIQAMFDEWIWLNGVFNIGDWIPWLGFLDLQGYVKKMKILKKRLDKFHNYVIEDHLDRMKREKNGFVAKDVVDVILKLAEDPNLEVKLTSDCIKGLIQDPISGGIDTSAITLEWAMSELLKQPNFFMKAIEELDTVVGRERWIEESDIPQLPYINAIMKETMRLHPVGTLLAPHFSLEDYEISGYFIPKGTTVFINVWGIGRDPKFWEEPEKFRPERFLRSDIDVKGRHFEFLPFGSGRRMCPAYNLALKIVQSTLANLIHGFHWTLLENMKPEDVDMEEHYGLTTHRASPIVALAKPRLPLHMY